MQRAGNCLICPVCGGPIHHIDSNAKYAKLITKSNQNCWSASGNGAVGRGGSGVTRPMKRQIDTGVSKYIIPKAFMALWNGNGNPIGITYVIPSILCRILALATFCYLPETIAVRVSWAIAPCR